MKYSDIYNNNYRLKYIKCGSSKLGQTIYANRWALILKHVQKGRLLDYGSGPGLFNDSGPDTFTKFNYDINPTCGFTTLPKEPIDILTMWDSIEHIPDFYAPIKKFRPKWLFLCTPNLANVSGPITQWKHYRPKEHLYYFDEDSLEVILSSLGYRILEKTYEEGALRDPKNPKAILTVVAQRWE